MTLEFHQIDAFSHRPFAGNPAMVYRLDEWLDASLMQAIAAEHNLAETAFVCREGDHWKIRWFTPVTEIDLCGHATLAAAYVLFDLYGEPGERLEFESCSGRLRVLREEEGRLALNFPARLPVAIDVIPSLESALGVTCQQMLSADKLLVVVDSEQTVRACRPDMAALQQWPQGVIVTAQASPEYDFVSRFFAPALGVPEDPVTGSAHCSLIPFWSQRLGKRLLRAYQCSARGGELWCRWDDDRVSIAGYAVQVASGRLLLGGIRNGID